MSHHFKKSDYRRIPWENGMGSTHQIDIFPGNSAFPTDHFLWRLSSAAVHSDSPFSLYPDHDRWLAVIRGEGLWLNDIRLDAHCPVYFSGKDQIQSRLIQGPVVDLGLIYDRRQVQAEMKIHEVTPEILKQKLNFRDGVHYLVCTQGQIQFNEEVLGTGETLRVDGEEEIELQLNSVSNAKFYHFHLRLVG
jgi:environmental stress-induced protein Ves